MIRSSFHAAVASWPSFACLSAVGFAIWQVLGSFAEARLPDGAIAVIAAAVPLDTADPAADRVGSLRYLGGLWLRSADPRFGGLSDLRLGEDGKSLRVVSDCGCGFTAKLGYDAAGRLSRLDDVHVMALRGPNGRVLDAGERDAESLAIEGASLTVAFEGTNRVLAYRADPPFVGPGRLLPAPPGLEQCGSNGGLETMAQFDDGRRLLVCETRRRASFDVPAWIGRAGGWRERSYPLVFDGGWAGHPFRPTSAAVLPGGDVLVLERRFPPIAARVVRLERSDLEGAGALKPREIARLEPPLTLDNFEGIETRQEAGRTLVYLISDDNHCGKRGGARGPTWQRTLLLLFALED